MKTAVAVALFAVIGCNGAATPGVLHEAATATIVLYVDRDHAGPVEDGTAGNPFATISQAVAVAAADASTAAYLIRVAPSLLSGPYADEALPIQLARPAVAIAGGTRFIDDEAGRPTAVVDGTQTNLGGQHVRDNQPFFYVTAANVSISGLVLTQNRTFGIVADGAPDFDFSDNDVENASLFGILAMHGAGGRISHSLFAVNLAGVSGTGGDGPPRLVLDSNNLNHNQPIGSVFTGAWEYTTQVDLAADGAPQLTPHVTHPQPTSIEVVETNNVFRRNECVGTRFMAFTPDSLTFDASTMAASTALIATVGGDGPRDGNLFDHNGCPGVNLDAGNGKAIDGVVYSAQMSLTSTHNTFDSNKNGPQVVSVGHFSLPYSGIKRFTAPFQELRNSTQQFNSDQPVDYWNPTHDVYACAQMLDDTVLINGTAVYGTDVDPSLLCPADQ
jgi:hypothetical protein